MKSEASQFLSPGLLLIVGLALLLAGCSLAGDVTPPPGFATPSNAAFAGVPLERPSAARGQAIFADHCAPCHGPQGNGDGEQAARLPNPPATLSDPQVARNASPAHWFEIVTNGRLDRFMPPFAEALTETQRWDVVSFLYTLSTPPDFLQQAQVLYQAHCAGCHGPQGKGDGPEGASRLPDFSDQALMADRSQADIYAVVSKGLGEVMPSFTAVLSEDQRWAIAALVQTFTLDPSLSVMEASTAATPPSEAEIGTVSGRITQGTAGGAIPPELAVVLHGFDSFQETLTLTTGVGADGEYLFPEVPLLSDRALIATVEYDGVLYSSDIAQAVDGQATFDLPLTIFDATRDDSALKIARLHIVFEFTPGQAEVGELYILSNTGDKTLTGETSGSPVVEFSLPEGATNLTFQEGQLGERFLQTAAGFADTVAIRPGEQSHQILLSFTMPYTSDLEFKQPVTYPTAGLDVLLPEASVQLSSAQLQDQGLRQAQDSAFRLFSGGALQPGQALELELRGRAASSSSVALRGLGSTLELIAGAGALSLVLGALGIWWLRHSRGADAGSTAPPEISLSAHALIRAIAALDDDYAAGKLVEADYQQHREKLKRQALEKMRNLPEK